MFISDENEIIAFMMKIVVKAFCISTVVCSTSLDDNYDDDDDDDDDDTCKKKEQWCAARPFCSALLLECGPGKPMQCNTIALYLQFLSFVFVFFVFSI